MCGVMFRETGYADALGRWSEGLAAGHVDGLLGEVAAGDARDLERFVLNTTEERCRLLTEELALVALAFDDFAGLVTRYVREVPRVAYDPAYSDSQRFLRWLAHRQRLTPQQRDFVAYQQAEYACLALARGYRAAHVSFQRLLSQSRAERIHFETDGGAIVHLNPVRVWSRLAALSPTPSQGAVDAVFFAVGTRICVMGPTGPRAAWLRALSAAEPCAWRAWAARCASATPSSSLEAFAREAAEAGLIAVVKPKETE